MDLASWPLWSVVASFLAAAVVIGFGGTRMTTTAELLARETGLGQAIFGAVFLGGSTSLPGIVASVVAAAGGHASLAVSNAIGGIAAQTVFLAVADMAHRGANLEHAAANIANLMQGALLITLLALPMLAMARPEIELLGVHPVSLGIVLTYAFGIRLISKASEKPMWTPLRTRETVFESKPAEKQRRGGALLGPWLRFCGLALLVALAGYGVLVSSLELSARTGLSESVVGAFLTSIATSLPELVTAVAAVRRGALTLAVGDVLGGNCFDILFVAASDFAFREGSLYAALTLDELFIMALTLLLTGILLLGLLRREKHGIGNIGFESFLVLSLYVGAALLLLLGSG